MSPLFTPVQPVLEALALHDVRAVGGFVRAWLRKDPLTNIDLDLATTANPDQIENCLRVATIPATDEGKRWGTITAHLGDDTYEITSLRQDAYSPGSRYPTVSFITDWENDAARRDFTINAIYLSQDETLFDPFDGATDLRNGIVRFIGNPETRLSEDPLRLYRFWRFCGLYGLGGVTTDLVQTFQQCTQGLVSVSRTRRQVEWAKLLETPQAPTVLAELQRHDLLSHLEMESEVKA
jgi:poly(A) polymerase